MNYLSALQQQESITVADSLNTTQQVIAKYLPMLRKILEIQSQLPVHDDEPAFRGAAIAKSAVPQLYEMLEKLHHAIVNLEMVLARAQAKQMEAPELLQLEQQISDKLIKMLSAAVKHCEAIYAQRSNTFAMILQDLQLLLAIIHSKIRITGQSNLDHSNDEVIIERKHSSNIAVAADEKLVFVRVFYREMVELSAEATNLQWVKPLLESVKQAEKHGMAIYENETDALKSLKGEAYGYVTLKIKKSQDISEQRPAKSDPVIGCRLVTIANVDLSNMVKLTHQAVEYLIQDGMLHKL